MISSNSSVGVKMFAEFWKQREPVPGPFSPSHPVDRYIFELEHDPIMDGQVVSVGPANRARAIAIATPDLGIYLMHKSFSGIYDGMRIFARPPQWEEFTHEQYASMIMDMAKAKIAFDGKIPSIDDVDNMRKLFESVIFSYGDDAIKIEWSPSEWPTVEDARETFRQILIEYIEDNSGGE